jgi:hypothetical protein
LRIVEARAAALATATLVWPGERPDGEVSRTRLPLDQAAAAAAELTGKGAGPVSTYRTDFVFEPVSPAFESLKSRLKN